MVDVTEQSGTECLFECPECENKATVESEYDGVGVLLGCSDGHETKTMVKVQRSIDTVITDNSDTEMLYFTDWIENQKERAEERIEDEEVGREETLRWEGERDLIVSIQKYLEIGVLELE